MKVIVMGAGVIGVTTAWYLAQEGHEVEVIDRQPGVGLETSFANAGQVSGLFHSLGHAGTAVQGREVDVREAQPARDPSAL